MRQQTQTFILKFLQEKGAVGTVLDVGSLYMGGPRLKLLFPEGSYTGLDMQPGEYVDIVMNGHDIKTKLSPDRFDCVMSFDCLEHDNKFWETLEGMKYVLKPGGYMLIGVPSLNCPLHCHPKDYWRFMPQSMETFYEGFTDLYEEVQKDDPFHPADDEIYMWGRKS